MAGSLGPSPFAETEVTFDELYIIYCQLLIRGIHGISTIHFQLQLEMQRVCTHRTVLEDVDINYGNPSDLYLGLKHTYAYLSELLLRHGGCKVDGCAVP